MNLSIITINYNNAAGLEKTIQSVINQSYNSYEYIIIDGGSTDDSIEVIKRYQSNISNWVSEPDNGVYDAMNKGIHKATGEYLLMLNSGDTLVSAETLQQVFEQPLEADIVYADLIWDSQGKQYEHRFPPDVTFRYFYKYTLGHQATFIRKKLHSVVGLYNSERGRIASDWEFFIQAVCKYSCSKHHRNILISICGRDGISCHPDSLLKIEQERKQVLNQHFGAYLKDYEELDVLHQNSRSFKKMMFMKIRGKINNFFKK